MAEQEVKVAYADPYEDSELTPEQIAARDRARLTKILRKSPHLLHQFSSAHSTDVDDSLIACGGAQLLHSMDSRLFNFFFTVLSAIFRKPATFPQFLRVAYITHRVEEMMREGDEVSIDFFSKKMPFLEQLDKSSFQVRKKNEICKVFQA